MFGDYGWIIGLAVGGLFLFLMMRRGGGCCGAGHGSHGGDVDHGSHGGHDDAATDNEGKKNRSHGGCC